MKSARWSSKEEIIEKLEKLTPKSKQGGPILWQRNGFLYTYTQESHKLILGLSGVGKTRRCVLPMVRTYIDKGESFIAMDVKGDVYKQTACYTKDKYNVKVLDFRNLDESDNWNPFLYIYPLYKSDKSKDQQRAVDALDALAHSIYMITPNDEPFWITSARNIFMGCAYILLELAEPEEINMSSIYELIMKGDERLFSGCLLQEVLKILPEDCPAGKLLYSYIEAPRETKSSMRSVMMENLAIFIKNKGLESFVSKDTLDINSLDNEKKPLAIYVIVPDETPVYDSLVTVLVSQLTSHFINLAEQKYAGVLPHRLNIVLEELGNNSAIPNLDRLLSASRSRNIRIQYVLQSLSQLEDIYGKSKAETIVSNTDITMAFRVNDWKTLQQLSEKCGMREVEMDGRISKENLITPSQLGAMGTGQALVMISGCTKFITQLPDYEEMFDCTDWKMPDKPLRNSLSAKGKVFDVKSKVKEIKRRELMKSVNKNTDMDRETELVMEEEETMHSFWRRNGIDIDAMIRDIDKKIEELDRMEEEAKKQQAKEEDDEGDDVV